MELTTHPSTKLPTASTLDKLLNLKKSWYGGSILIEQAARYFDAVVPYDIPYTKVTAHHDGKVFKFQWGHKAKWMVYIDVESLSYAYYSARLDTRYFCGHFKLDGALPPDILELLQMYQQGKP